MPFKKVLLYADDTLFETGVRGLISNNSDIDLAVVRAKDDQDLLQRSAQVLPDVLIVECDILDKHAGLLANLHKILPNSRVITLDRNHNVLHVYTRQDVLLTQSSDLIGLIRSQNPFSSLSY